MAMTNMLPAKVILALATSCMIFYIDDTWQYAACIMHAWHWPSLTTSGYEWYTYLLDLSAHVNARASLEDPWEG